MADSDGAEGEGEERRMRGLFFAILFAESLGPTPIQTDGKALGEEGPRGLRPGLGEGRKGR